MVVYYYLIMIPIKLFILLVCCGEIFMPCIVLKFSRFIIKQNTGKKKKKKSIEFRNTDQKKDSFE